MITVIQDTVCAGSSEGQSHPKGINILSKEEKCFVTSEQCPVTLPAGCRELGLSLEQPDSQACHAGPEAGIRGY